MIDLVEDFVDALDPDKWFGILIVGSKLTHDEAIVRL
jgi:hypothetical protein